MCVSQVLHTVTFYLTKVQHVWMMYTQVQMDTGSDNYSTNLQFYVHACADLWGFLANWDAAWQYTAVEQCPCVSPGVWLFSRVCPCPAGPQSDEHDSPFFLFSLSFYALSLCSSTPIPLLYLHLCCLRCTVSSRGHREGHMELHCYIFVYLSPLFLFIDSTFWAWCP